MYAESTPVTLWGGGQHPVGLHFGTIAQLATLPGVTVNGLDPRTDASALYGLGGPKTEGQPVQIEAQAGDPQTERDLVHLGVAVARSGNGLPFFGRDMIPTEAVNEFSNLFRVVMLGLPQEGPTQLPPEKIEMLRGRMGGRAASLQKGSPYPENSEKNAPDHSAPGHDLPDKVNEIYNALMRDHPEYGKEKAMRIAWSQSGLKHEKKGAREPVNGEMSATLSKWTVVSLGEMQQPGGVGATQDDFNPVLGENPLGPPSADNADNSFEQSKALETWVNYAVDMLNRGEGDQAVMAQLAHDGCPNPKDILERAKQQPMDSPVTDEIGQDAFENPPPADAQSGQMESLERQPPVMAKTKTAIPIKDPAILSDLFQNSRLDEESNMVPKEQGLGDVTTQPCANCGGPTFEYGPGDWRCVDCGAAPNGRQYGGPNHGQPLAKRVRIAGTSMTGVEVDRWEDLWGQGTVKIALDEGGVMNVAPGAVEEVEPESVQHPVTQIQEFIDGLEPVEPTRPHIEARIANLEAVRRACRQSVSEAGFHDQVRLASMDSDAQNEILALKEFLGAVASESDMAYLSGLQTYRPHGTNYPGIDRPVVSDAAFRRKIAEKAAIFVAELPDEMVGDQEAVAYAAAVHAYASNGDVPEFVRLAEEHRVVRTEEFAPVEETTEETDNDGPAEGLFI